jgi:hypothetical protein
MEDEEYGDGQPDATADPMQEGAGPLAVLATLGSNYTSKEAHDLSKTAYEQLQKERTDITLEEDEVSEDMKRTAEEAKAQLRQARDRLLARKADESEKWFKLAEGLGKPTKTGTFGEVVGNVAHGQDEYRADRQKFLDDQETGALGYGQDIAKIDAGLQERRRLIAKVRRESNARLLEQTMKNFAKEVRPGGGGGSNSMSPFGKIAKDLGYMPGTVEFAKKVDELEKADARNKSATAGTDAPGETAEDAENLQAVAMDRGVPIAVIDPYRGMSTKQKNAAMPIEQRNIEQRLGDMAKAQSDARDGITKMNRFMKLNERVDSGAFKGRLPALTAAEQEMDAITAEVSRKMKQPGEGSVSDFDARMFINATVARTKGYGANKNIAEAYKIMRRNEIDRISFLQDFAAVNGHLRGADAEWRDYIESNPIFIPHPTKPGVIVVNTKRPTYKDYFRSKIKSSRDEAAAADENAVDPSVLSADDNLPGHFPGEDIPAKAGGGRVYAKGGPVEDEVPEELADIVAGQEGAEELPDVEVHPDDELRNALYAALQGITGGTADEIRSTVDPKGAAEDRAGYSKYYEQHPYEKAAAFAAGMAPIAALAPAGGLANAALLGVLSGAETGAAGAGEGERGKEALVGGLEGAVVAPAAMLGTRYVYNQAGRLYDKVTGKALSSAEEKLVLAANKDNIDLSQVASDLRASDRMGVPEGVADAGGRRTRALIERAATRGGPESERFLEEEAAKQGKSYSRVEDQIHKGMAPSEYFGEFEKLNKELYTASKPLYNAAYKKNPGVKSNEFMKLMDTKDGKRAFDMAKRLMDLDGKPIGKANIAGIVQKPSLEFLDYYKRGLDQLIKTEEAAGPTTLGHSLRQARNRLRDELDNAVPDYKKAREQYAGDLEMRDALKMGREDFASMQPEEIRKKVAGMTWAEKDVFKSGVSQHLFEILGKPTTDFNAAQRILGSESMRAKLEATFDDPKKWKIFEAAMDKEAAMYDRTRKMTSRVEGKKAQALGKEESILSGALDQGMSNVPGMGGISWTNRVYNWLRFPMPMSEATADGILKAINRGDVRVFDETMKRLAQGQSRLKIRGKRAGKLGAIAAVLGAAMSQPTPRGEPPPKAGPVVEGQ